MRDADFSPPDAAPRAAAVGKTRAARVLGVLSLVSAAFAVAVPRAPLG